VDGVLTRDSAGFRELVQRRLTQLIDQQQLGIVIDQIDLTAIPPRQLKERFTAVSEAGTRRGKVLNDARNYESQTINAARAEAARRKAQAQADRTLLVASLAAEAERFTHLLPQYRSNPELFVRQYRTETINRVMTNVYEKWVIPPGSTRIELDREAPKLKTLAPRPGEPGH
jgi:membrane protease subunit HflK